MNTVERAPVVHDSLRGVAVMAFATLGVIYSDLATSVLIYTADVLNGVFPAAGDVPSTEDVVGAVSAIVWALTMLPLIKYAFIALRFGTGQGEGGPFALFTSLFPRRDEEGDDIAAITTYTRTGTRLSDSDKDKELDKLPIHEGVVTRLINIPFVYSLLLAIAIFAVALTLSDGALTPAVSVVTAVVGLQVAIPSLTGGAIIGISAAILIGLFAVQPFGTRRIAFLFSPLVTIWLLTLAIPGIINITHYPGIWRAYDPSRLVLFFVRTGDWTVLSGVLLAVTGAEALFACLGQFSSMSISLAFSCFVYPCIVLAYLGQGARLIVDGADVLPNLFYLTIPGGVGSGLYWFTFVMGIIAAIIASQAMITASFSLLVQLMAHGCIPRIRTIRTSDTHAGQVFIPSACIVICAASVGLVAGFGTDAGLTNAYGLAVSSVFICTTLFVALSIPVRKGLPIVLAVAFFLWFGFVDGLFFAASLFKVPHGAYVPLAASLIILAFCIFYTWARNLELEYAHENRARLHTLLAPYQADPDASLPVEEDEDDDTPRATSSAVAGQYSLSKLVKTDRADDEAEKHELTKVSPAYTSEANTHLALRLANKQQPLPRIPLVALFHKVTSGSAVPASFETFLRSYPGLPTIVIFLCVKYAAVPHLASTDRLEVRKIRTVAGFYRATARFGYRDAVDLRDIADPLVDLITSIEARETEDAGQVAETVNAVRAAARSAVTHVIASYVPVARPSTVTVPILGKLASWGRALLLEGIYGRLQLLFPDDQDYKTSDAIVRIAVQAEL